MSKKETIDLKDLKADKEGFLEYQKTSSDPKKKTTWIKLYFRLTGGSLYFYKEKQSSKAKGVVQLKGVKIEEQTIDKKNSLVLSSEGNLFIISGNDIREWSQSLQNNLNHEPILLELKGETAKMGFIMKAKKTLLEKLQLQVLVNQ